MKSNHIFPHIIFLVTLCLTACNKKAEHIDKFKQVNLKVEIMNDAATIESEFSNFEIFPLENKQECILNDIGKMIVTESGMLFFDKEPTPQVLFFRPDGTFRNRIGRRGHAKGEYQMILNIAANKTGDSVAVISYPNINFYDKTGNYLSTWNVEKENGPEDLLFTEDGIYLGCFHRQGKSLMTRYRNNLTPMDNIVDTPEEPIGTPLGVDNGNLIQQDGDNIFCLDALDSKLYVYSNKNPKNITCYSLDMNNMRSTAQDKETAGTDDDKYRITSYWVYKDIVRGTIENNEGYYDFKFSLSDNVVTLMHHIDLNYSFDSIYMGYFYKVVPASTILDYTNPQKRYLEPIRDLFKDKLTGLRGNVSISDNYYIIRMKALDK